MGRDYKKALNDMEGEMSFEQWADRHYETIRHALLIADKLMQEPSEEMWEVGVIFTNAAFAGGYEAEAESIFKAMRDQLLREAK